MYLQMLEQGSDEWKNFRLGKITGTRLGTLWSSRQYSKQDILNLLDARGVEYNKKLTKAQLEEEYLTEADKEDLSSDTVKKLEYYQILADQVSVPRDEELDANGDAYYNMMDRGTALEDSGAQSFAELSGLTLFQVGCCVSDADPRIINSPDRLVLPEGVSIDLTQDIVKLPQNITITEAVEVKCLASAKHLMAFFERKIPEEYWTQKVQYFTVNPNLQRLYWVFHDPRIPMLPTFVLVIEREDLGHWPETMLKYQLRTLKELDALTIRLFDESDNVILPARAEKGV